MVAQSRVEEVWVCGVKLGAALKCQGWGSVHAQPLELPLLLVAVAVVAVAVVEVVVLVNSCGGGCADGLSVERKI